MGVKRKYKDKREIEYFNIPTSLKSIVNPKFTKIVKDLAFDSTQLLYEATLLIDLYVYYNEKANIDQNLLNRTQTTVTLGYCNNDGVLNSIYKEKYMEYREDFRYVKFGYLSGLIRTNTSTFLINYEQHFNENFVKQMEKFHRRFKSKIDYEKIKKLSIHQKYKWFKLLSNIPDFKIKPIPLTDKQTKFITIDNITLFNILQRFNKISKLANLPRNPTEFYENQAKWWKFVFPGLRRLTKRNFHFQVGTDGISASVLFEREKKINQVKKEKKPPNRVIGIDPGKKDMLVSSEYIGNEILHKRVSTASYYSDSKFTKRKKKLEKWRDRIYEAEVPCRRNSLEYIKFMLTFRSFEQLKFYNEDRILKLRFNCKVHKQKSFWKIIRKITGNDGAVTLAFGNASSFGAAKGHLLGPIKEFKRFICKQTKHIIEEIDEYKTSKLCSKCNGLLSDVFEEGRKIHHVKNCKDCLIWWNRDENASINILNLYLNGGCRASFSRTNYDQNITPDHSNSI